MLHLKLNLYKKLNPNELTPAEFAALQKEITRANKTELSDQYCDFMLWCRELPSRQKQFADFIIKKLSKHPGAKILEVGCGRTAILSRQLSKHGFQMTCIDPKLELSSIQKYPEIKGICGKFDYKTFDLSGFDYVIAVEPCDATEHVVRACIATDTPFFMSLCGVPHKLLDGKMPKNHNEWYQYLKNIAPDHIKLIKLPWNPLFLTEIIKSKNF